MPQSSQRHKHKHPSHTNPRHEPAVIKPRRKRNAALLMAIFIGFLGLAIGSFATGMNYSWMIASASIGAIAGALIGHGIDRSIERKG
jgi:outer membrane lipoprotein SlyB